MKYFLSFVFGAACGIGATLLYLRKDIQKELAEIRENSIKDTENAAESSVSSPESNDVPFEVSEGKTIKNAVTVDSDAHRPIAVQRKTRIAYENLIRDNYGGEVQNPSEGVTNITKKEEGPAGMGLASEVSQEIFDSVNGRHWEPIDGEEFDNNPGFDKDKLIFYAGDRILATEHGTVIENGYVLIGDQWEDEVGHYADRTAYIRNHKTAIDYEIYVEAGLYSDEWGSEGAPLVED